MSGRSEQRIDLSTKNKVALKLLGGGVPNVGFQLGVCEALEDFGFTFSTGIRSSGEKRKYGPRVLNPLIGSSSGAFTALALAMGYGREDLLGRSGRIQPIDEGVIKDRIETNPLAFIKRLWTSRQKYTRLKKLVQSEPSTYEHLINTYYPIWKMDALEQYMRSVLLDGAGFSELQTEVLILAVAQEQRMTFIFGDHARPQQPGDDFKFQDGLEPWEAAAGSMSLPPYYRPYRLDQTPKEIEPEPGEGVVLIDGETRDPFSTDAAEDSEADLIIVSSFYRVMEYTEQLGHIDDYGILPVMWQERAQGKDARKLRSITNRRRRKEVLHEFRAFLERFCPENCEDAMARMEEIVDFRENVDVIEIQAQEYQHEALTYPYWDPFTLEEEVLDFLFEAGYSVAEKELEKQLKPLK